MCLRASGCHFCLRNKMSGLTSSSRHRRKLRMRIDSLTYWLIDSLTHLTSHLNESMSQSKMIQAIFFDFNGVIINDERIHLKAYREVLNAHGVELTDADYFASLGMDDVAFVRAAFARANKPLADELARDVIEREHAWHREFIARDLPVASGVVAFIKQLSRTYDLGIVSMAERSEIDHVLDLVGLKHEFFVVVSAAA